MSRETANRKRKAVTRDSPESNEAAIFDELGNRALDAGSSQSGEEEDSDFDESEGSEVASLDEEELDDDEIPSEESDVDDAGLRPKLNGMKHLDINEDEGESDELDEKTDDQEMNYTITEDANGNPRYVYREIDPVYDSDDSDAPATTNTIGNIPLTFYDSYPHIGYDINGQKIMRPAKGQALDSLLDSIDIPQGWTGLTDPATGKPLQLNEEELDVLRKLTRNEADGEGYDPYPEMVEYFTGKVEQMPLSAAPEPKRRFVPSKHEAKRVMKIVRAMKEGRIRPYKPASEEEPEEDPGVKRYDIWENEAPRPDHPMNIPAPKLPPPGYEESYHPPPEYLPDEDELKAYNETDAEDREKEYLPTDHDALRKVPGYERLIKEKFERCLDLYLAPRVRRSKLNIDPESLLPKLPSPEELRPFPSKCEKVFRGHEGRVRSIAVSPHGDMIASGGSDGTARIWDFQGRQLWKAKLSDQDAVNEVQWRPGTDAFILTAAAGETLFFILPSNLLPIKESPEIDAISNARDLLNAGWQSHSNGSSSSNKQPPAKWQRPVPTLQELGVFIQVTLRSTIKVISWHRRGDHIATVAPQGARSAVTIHTLSKHLTQVPFRRLKGLPQAVQFHPLKPILFVATQRLIRSYDLVKQEPLKILQPGARWIAGFDVHPAGENLIVASYDKRLLWMDMELDVRPYKVLRYHERAIRAAKYHHGGFPLFCDASDDGSVQVFHGKVVGDLMQNANIVPIKKLWGHAVEAGLGVLDIDWHPSEPWIVSAGADGTCRLWT